MLKRRSRNGTPADKEAHQGLTPARHGMTPGLGFALGAMLAFGVSDLIYKRAAAAGIEAGEFIMLQAWAFCPGITLYAWLTGTLDPHLSALWGSLAGFFLLIAAYNFVRSLQGGAVSTNAPIFRLNFTITAALAILLLGETLTVTKAAALVCALAAVWLLLAEASGPTLTLDTQASARTTGKLDTLWFDADTIAGAKRRHRTTSAKRGKPNVASIARVLIATMAMALTNFFYKVGLQHGAVPETIVAAQAWMFCSLATLMRVIGERRFLATPGAWRYSTVAAVALLVAFVMLMHALARGPASVLVPVAQMSFVFTALLGAAMFRESLDRRKCAGLAVAAVALALFAIS